MNADSAARGVHTPSAAGLKLDQRDVGDNDLIGTLAKVLLRGRKEGTNQTFAAWISPADSARELQLP